MAVGKEEYENTQAEIQSVIDSAYHKGRFILSLDYRMQETYKAMVEKYVSIWNASFDHINGCIKSDTEQNPNDNNIGFKWGHLVPQEIGMWMRLCCFNEHYHLEIDIDVEKYKHGFVTQEEFDSLCERRGFTKSMRDFLINVLGEIGIGSTLRKE